MSPAPADAPPPAPAPARFEVHAYPLALRLLAQVAQGLALGTLLYFTARLALDVAQGAQRVQPGPVLRGLALFLVLPMVGLRVLRRLCRATVEVEAARLVLTLRRGARMEIPFEVVAAVRPWWLPLPGPGLSLRMRSGRRFAYGLEVEDPVPLLAALGQHGVTGAAEPPPLVRYAHARHALWRRRWYHLAFKFILFPLPLAALFFRAHQYIAYGGPFGELQMYGWSAYLRSFGRIWLPVELSLLLLACFWRALVEPLCLAAAWGPPGLARGVRHAAEWLCRLVYYVGVPALVAVRFLA